MKIRHLHHNQINPSEWDRSILNSRVPLVYGLYDYLDALCNKNWSALVFGEYEAVFPLPHKTKLGITYIVQPVFCQQLGAFGSNRRITSLDFLRAIPKKFIRVRLQLNPYFDNQQNASLTTKTNFLLPLSEPPTYNKDCRKNLATLSKLPIEYHRNAITFKEVIDVYREAWGETNPNIGDSAYEKFEDACKRVQSKHQCAFTLAATNTETSSLLGASILLGFPSLTNDQEKHLHYVCAGPTKAGKTLGIMHGIIDAAIQGHLGATAYFDFEGSSIPSVATFYQKFGPKNTPYYLFQRGI